jgi:hypothetical protein
VTHLEEVNRYAAESHMTIIYLYILTSGDDFDVMLYHFLGIKSLGPSATRVQVLQLLQTQIPPIELICKISANMQMRFEIILTASTMMSTRSSVHAGLCVRLRRSTRNLIIVGQRRRLINQDCQ